MRPFQSFQKLPESGIAELIIPFIINLYNLMGGCSEMSILTVKVKQPIIKFSKINCESWVNLPQMIGYIPEPLPCLLHD